MTLALRCLIDAVLFVGLLVAAVAIGVVAGAM